MSKIAVIGHFAHGQKGADGQTVKTRLTAAALSERFSDSEVTTYDTFGWKRHPFTMLKHCIQAHFSCDDVIIMPARNGLTVFMPLFALLRLVRKTKLHYVVIGSWLTEVLNKHKLTAWSLKQFSGIYVETSLLAKQLKIKYPKIIYLVPNFKILSPVATAANTPSTKTLRLCMFMRVMKEKGIEDAIEAITRINQTSSQVIYSLDIYGQVDKTYQERFKHILETTPRYIAYKGIGEADKSTAILKKYYMLLFPTHFMTEGIPGTIIDALAAGLPVVATKWNNFSDILTEGKTGFGFSQGNTDEFVKILFKCRNTKLVDAMRKNCVAKAYSFTGENALQPLFLNIAASRK